MVREEALSLAHSLTAAENAKTLPKARSRSTRITEFEYFGEDAAQVSLDLLRPVHRLKSGIRLDPNFWKQHLPTLYTEQLNNLFCSMYRMPVDYAAEATRSMCELV
jgi:hypothetical protein